MTNSSTAAYRRSSAAARDSSVGAASDGTRQRSSPAISKWLTARGHDLDVGAVTQQRVRQRGAACQQVLAVVQDQECLARTEVSDQRGEWIGAGRER